MSKDKPPYSILVVDDEQRTLNSLQGLLRRDYSVFVASSGAEAISILAARPIHVILSDQRMDTMSGADLLCDVRERHPSTIRMLMTGYSDTEAIMRAVNQGQIFGYIAKPWKVEDLLLTIQQATNHWEALESNRRLTDELRKANEDLERKVDERTRELNALENFKESIITSLQSGLMVVSRQGIIETINPAGASIFGAPVEDLRRKPLDANAVSANFKAAVEQTLAQQGNLEFQELVHDRGGELQYIGFGTSLLKMPDDPLWGVVVIYRDVTEKKNLEQQLIQSEKLASIGELAGGVAHEINNPLGVILGFAQLLLKAAPTDEKVLRKLKHIETQALRCKSIVQTLLKFSRKSHTDSSLVNLNQVINDTIDLLRRQLEVENIQLKKDAPEEALMIRANENEIQQVFFNLIVNAKDAMPNGGNLILRTIRKKGRVRIEVEDSGTGIDPRNKEKIFNTFFTTKPVGKGTGLGLSIARSLVQKYGGVLSFDSVMGQGTTFYMEFDEGRTREDEDQTGPAREDLPVLEGLKILVVDDEEDILNLCRDLLKDNNDVQLASDARIALKMMETTKYDLLLCDIMMPHLDGVRLLESLRDTQPGTRPPVVVMTGRPPKELVKQKDSLGIIEIVTKPFTLGELQSVLRKAWETYRASSGGSPMTPTASA